MSMKTKDGLRAAIFAEHNRKPKVKELTLFGEQVELHQPTLAQINNVAKAAADAKLPAIVYLMIEYTYVPGTNEKLFDKADADSLATMPSGKWLDDFNKAMEEITGVDVKSAEKNSEETVSS